MEKGSGMTETTEEKQSASPWVVESAPPGYWWMVGALVAMASAAMLLHESASWALDLTTWLGSVVNIRAYSCDAHSLGLVFGYAITQVNGSRFRRLMGNGLFWTVFFVVQFANVLAYYALMGAAGLEMPIVFVQFVGGASGAAFFVAVSQIASSVSPRLFVTTVVAVVALTTFIVQGLFSMLEATAPLMASALLHLALVAAAGACFLRGASPQSCFREGYGTDRFVAIRSQEEGRVAPYMRLFLIVGVYAAVFGFLHVIPLALPLGVVARVTSFLVGAVIALALFAVTLRGGRSAEVSVIWNRFYRFVFPIVTVAALLGPLTNSTEFLPALIMQACALYYFDALLAMACYVISRAINAAPFQVFARAFLIRSIGFLLGNMVGSFVYEHVTLDTAAFSVIGATVFVLLCLVTFNMNSERYAKTVWGLLPHEDPRGRYERDLDERCDSLAARFALTERETEVLRLLARGKRPKEISDTLVVSVATVRSHVHAIYTKADVHSAEELQRLISE